MDMDGRGHHDHLNNGHDYHHQQQYNSGSAEYRRQLALQFDNPYHRLHHHHQLGARSGSDSASLASSPTLILPPPPPPPPLTAAASVSSDWADATTHYQQALNPASASDVSIPTLGKRSRNLSLNTTSSGVPLPLPTTTGYEPPKKQIKRERGASVSSLDADLNNNNNNTMSTSPNHGGSRGESRERVGSSAHDDPMPSTSDFVKKLYKMLEDPSFQSVVSWGPQGDCFVVKDMNEFTKSILPRMFKHSNFASFVRQLNKYDFHKVKNTDDNQFGEHSWTFRHPDFHADRRDALENIKRKVPAQRKSQVAVQQQQAQQQQAAAAAAAALLSGNVGVGVNGFAGQAPFGAAGAAGFGSQAGFNSSGYLNPQAASELHSEIRRLKDDNEDLKGRLRSLERNYESVLVEMVSFQRGMAQQDGLMQSMIQYFLGSVGDGKLRQTGSPTSGASPTPSLTALQAQVQAQAQLHQQQLNTSQTQLQLAVQQHAAAQAQAERTSSTSGGSEARGEAQQKDQLTPPNSASAVGGPTTAVSNNSGNNNNNTNSSGNVTTNPLLPFLASTQADPNPFLPQHAAQKMGWGMQPDVGRATLMQMSELSRRAAAGGSGLVGWSGEAGSGAGPQPPGAGGGGGSMDQRMMQGASKMGLLKIEDSQVLRERERWGGEPRERRERRDERGMDVDQSQSQQQQQQGRGQVRESLWSSLVGATSAGSGMGSESLTNMGGLMMMGENPEASMHEGLQVYTVGHLMPRGTYPEDMYAASLPNASPSSSASGSTVTNAPPPSQSQTWSFDPTGLAAGGLLGGLGIGSLVDSQSGRYEEVQSQQQQGGRNQRNEEGSGSDDEDEIVQPSINTTDENGTLVVQSAPSPGRSPKLSSSSAGNNPGSSSSNMGSSSGEILSVSTPGVLGASGGSGGGGSQRLRVRRSTFVPGWAVPPRVLLVDDDAVSRKLSSKFLQVFGCTTDVAVDGVGAVNKMNLEKYDLVLMDIVMPKLDGVSATSIIRKFDKGTPIISMTSNSKPNEIMTYYSSGMNDILPKPFSKQGLLDMLEKHLMHLKVIQQISRNVPRGPGIPPLSDFGFEQALAANAGMSMGSLSGALMLPPSSSGAGPSGSSSQQDSSSMNVGTENSGMSSSNAISAPSPFNFNFLNSGSGMGDGNGADGDEYEGRINPLAAMGLTDEQYNMMVQNLVSGEGLLGQFDGASGSGSASGSSSGSSQGQGGATMMYGVGINFGMGDSSSGMSSGSKRVHEDDLEGPIGKKSRFEVIG